MEEMNENFRCQTKLTEFAPLAPEEKEQGVGHLISKIFKFGKSAITGESSNASVTESSVTGDNVSQESFSSWSNVDCPEVLPIHSSDTSQNFQYPDVVNEGRNLPNVLKRISNLLALKSTNLQAYEDTELRQYWMADSVSRECYECCEKFTTFRRRHHCRICGQIFCSNCCNQRIPGKIVGCTGDLRACRYCCKVVLVYLQSSEVQLTADLRAFLEDLQSKFASDDQLSQNITSINSANSDTSETGSLRRKISIGFQEDKFALGRGSNTTYLSTEERIRALQTSISLRNLYDELIRPTTGIILQTHRYRIRSYPNTLLGSELVDWIISQRKANSRIQASAICQALLEAGYLDCVTEQSNFCDGWALYRLQLPVYQEITQQQPEQKFDARNQDEPSWMQQVPHESSTTDSEAELPSPCTERPVNRMASSSSSYLLDLNLEDSTVHLIRPPPSAKINQEPVETEQKPATVIPADVPVVKTSQHREHVPETGWHNATNLRDDNGERVAYELLTNAYKQHEFSLLGQLLCANTLSLNWREIIIPLVHEVVNKIRPDLKHDAEFLDIRNYIQFKKLTGGSRTECKLVEGIVYSKNIVHKGMAAKVDNPRILLLNCSLVYQRTEGRLMSLEPVILQEHEYLRNVAARIVALQPNIVLVHRNVSRLAQDLLREHKITLVLNVKLSILERLARCTGADLISSVDAQVGRAKLGTCKHFYLKTFTNNETGARKTLMFFEGLPVSHLGATILLRGGSKSELSKLKQVISMLIFASYNWRLEKSFLMDEFAQPPKADEFFGDGSSKESSPDFHVNKTINDSSVKPSTDTNNTVPNENDQKKLEASFNRKQFDYSNSVTTTVVNDKEKEKDKHNSSNSRVSCDDKKLPVESVEDFSDPLHLYLNVDDDVFNPNTSQDFHVKELPFFNKFRKALDDTILSVSPYLTFSIPYLETEIGRKCKLRLFFPEEIYYSEQFLLKSENDKSKSAKENVDNQKVKLFNEKLRPAHPFVSVNMTTKISDSNEIQGLLANFRACGGRLPLKAVKFNDEQNKNNTINNQNNNTNSSAQLKRSNDVNRPTEVVDILDIRNHEKLVVLFCSFSHVSNNAPAFCVDPWVVNMYFYGTDDIPLGCFLERFCFRTTYECPSETCETPMLKHVRRFVHSSGCVSLSLNTFESPCKEENIVMWSCCMDKQCTKISPVVPMSSDTWSFSLAKFLELKFHGHIYSLRGNENDCCPHSLHHEHYQYFGYKNIVATFRYTSIKQWEVSLPPPLVQIIYDAANQQTEIINEIKSLALQGHEIFATISEKLTALPNEAEATVILKQLLQKEHNIFKGKVEEAQLKLTSPTLENKNLKEFSKDDVCTLIWPLEDLMVQIKRLIAETVENWNSRLSLGSNKKDSDKRKTTPAATSSSYLIEDADVSETEGGSGGTAAAAAAGVAVPADTQIENESAAPKPENVAVAESTPATAMSSTFTKKIKSLDHGDLSDDNASSHSPKGHIRSQSDGTVMAPPQSEDILDSKKESTDKKSVKAILTQLLQSIHGITQIQCPFGQQEHHLLPVTLTVPLVVYENEPGSIIAYALDSVDYRCATEEILSKKVCSVEQSSPSPVHKRKLLANSDRPNSTDLYSSSTGAEKHFGILSFLWNQKDGSGTSPVMSSGETSEPEDIPPPNRDKLEDPKKSKPPYIEVEFQDSHCNFCCRIYYAERFVWLRKNVIPAGEEAFIRSLRRTIQWNARGGKSGSTFCKTKDDRFILKEMNKQELQQFLDSANNYFTYMEKCLLSAKIMPTLLGKIVGVYTIMFRNVTTNANGRTNLLVMENLFYNRTVTHKFDLKGSMRNRLVNPTDQDGEIVLLDENLLKRTCESPLYIYPHSKAVLTAAIQRDTKFLSSQKVMDYSLLVGLDEDTQELVVGIIDYIRTFTWDKKLEHMVKKASMLGSQGKTPTIVSPENYRDRFIAAMHRYFLQVPDRWTGLGRGIEC